MTTSAKPSIPSIVELSAADRPLLGRVVCDDLVEIYEDEVKTLRGALTPATMLAVNIGLAAALDLPLTP